MSARLTIRLLGYPEILLEGRPLSGLGSGPAEALLIYLACHQNPLPRQKLAGLLYDGQDPAQAAADLDASLSTLRRELDDYLLINQQAVSFNHASEYWLDTAEFERHHDHFAPPILSTSFMSEDSLSCLQAGLDLYRGDFLEGFPAGEGRGFEGWATLERDRLARLAALLEARMAYAGIRQGATQQARHQLESLLPEAYETDNGALISFCLQSLGLIAGREGNYDRALQHAKKAAETISPYTELYQYPVFCALGDAAFAAGDLDRAAVAHQKAYSLAQVADLCDHAAPIYQLAMGRLARRRGEPAEAKKHLDEALALARDKGDQAEIAACLVELACQSADLGDCRVAGQLLDEAVQLATALGDDHLLASIDRARGWLAECQGDPVAARRFYQRNLKLLQENRDLAQRPFALAYLGRIYLKLGDQKAADTHLWQALSAFQTQGHLGGLALAHAGFGSLKREQRAFEAAGAHTEAALEAALAAGEIYFALQAVVERAFFLAAGGFHAESLSLLAFAQEHPAITAPDKARAAVLFAELEGLLSPEEVDAGRAWAVGKTPAELLQIPS